MYLSLEMDAKLEFHCCRGMLSTSHLSMQTCPTDADIEALDDTLKDLHTENSAFYDYIGWDGGAVRFEIETNKRTSDVSC